MRSGNPALNDKTFDQFDNYYAQDGAVERANVMTLEGTATKTCILLFLVVGGAFFTWNQFNANPAAAMPWMIGGAISGLILAFVTIFKPAWSPVTSPMYAIAEGLLLGALSASVNARFPGIAFQAVCLTFGTLFTLLLAYQTGIIKATENFKLGVVAATGGIFVVYLISWIAGMFGMNIPYIHGSGLIGIGFSIFVVIIAALNLVLDFDFIETGVEHGAPKYMEWYGAFGLLVTLIWLYIEILRLLAKLQSRD
ncbi:MAG: Bax inhibitor-1/YccA family protein [Planctomycetaceae bacterium]|nr:Bax inhibitor-1/YccA family protein [Planctomycetaceae bacterium]